MIAASSSRRFSWQACGCVALAAALTAAGCGGNSTGPDRVTTTTTSVVATTTTTTAPATTTTSTATTSTATTSIPGLTGSFRVEGTPCIAGGSGSVSCKFIATATGGVPPYTFNWRFQNPANNNSATPSGMQVDPVLGCDIATGVATFNVNITLTIVPASGSSITVTGTQQIVRAAGACGT